MRALLALTLLSLAPARQAEPARGDPLTAQQRFELAVVHWEGTFGTYLAPAPGNPIHLDLARIGTREVLGMQFGDKGRIVHFDLAHLEPRIDRVDGNAQEGWTRRVVLAGRQDPGDTERTVLELIARHEVERFEPNEPRRRLSSNITHLTLRVHTLRDDDTLREYARAGMTIDRDTGQRIPPTRD